MSVLKVGYWPIRGLVEPIHMYLAYKEVPHEKVVYPYDNIEKWTEQDKKNLGIDFPNIPYIIDGEFKLSQSNSILKYLEGKFGSYYNGDLAHDIKLDTLLDSVYEIRVPFGILFYMEGDLAKKKEEYQSPRILSKFEYFNEWLRNRKYLTGDSVCVADFAFWNLVDYHNLFDIKILEKYENIQRFKRDLENEPKVKEYLNSPDYRPFPINAWMAQWGGKDQAD